MNAGTHNYTDKARAASDYEALRQELSKHPAAQRINATAAHVMIYGRTNGELVVWRVPSELLAATGDFNALTAAADAMTCGGSVGCTPIQPDVASYIAQSAGVPNADHGWLFCLQENGAKTIHSLKPLYAA